MSGKTRFFSCVSAVALAAACLTIGCGKKKEEAPPTATQAAAPKGPDYQVFAPLPRAVTEMKLPWVMSEDMESVAQCFKPVETQPSEAGFELKNALDENKRGAGKAIAAWLVEVVEPDGITKSMAENWDMKFEDVVSMEATPEEVRFVDDSDCLGSAGWLPKDRRLITAVVGVKKIEFETQLPVPIEPARNMADALKDKGVTMESDALFNYEPAKDDAGNPILDAQGKPMYTSPAGVPISEKEFTQVAPRSMNKWTLRMEAPLYVGVRELPAAALRKESGKGPTCDVVIIPDVEKPQEPDCAEFQESAFTVTIAEGEDKPVRLTIVTDGKTKGVNLDWKEAAKVQVNDRIIIWLQPEKVEVGINLKLNSLVINPRPLGATGGGGDGYSEGGVFLKEPKSDPAPETAAASDEDTGGKKGKKKKGKGKDKAPEEKAPASGDSLEDYLNQ